LQQMIMTFLTLSHRRASNRCSDMLEWCVQVHILACTCRHILLYKICLLNTSAISVKMCN
jgi:hypothetical protein